ncbi:hypothetical protein QJS10_CPB15g00789 [Acorus calamus]|uniref:Uncharacterized protein n=1 Tax=Acorus calamus TaxID=4465 RepID=A0AAV9D7Z7_ACOCL|nr:hypothetical protein QJS10_CPB15g00789 [Acorus calamus]
MASTLQVTAVRPISLSPRRRPSVLLRNLVGETRISGGDPGSRADNAVLKLAWYGSELLGIAASVFRPSPSLAGDRDSGGLAGDGSGSVDRARVVEAVKEDFERSYFVTGNLTLDAYEENCEFADPAGSFKGLSRFKRNCSNFGALLEKSNMKLTKWEEFEACRKLECSKNGIASTNI